MPVNQILCGDALEVLRTLPDESAYCCVTSPPYWGLRDYGIEGQVGLEPTPEEYVAKLVEVFREVRRVLRGDGTLWLNLGDTYNSAPGWGRGGGHRLDGGKPRFRPGAARADGKVSFRSPRNRDGVHAPGLKPKDLMGIPWRVAFALQADGWWLRSDIIWHKPNAMPESVRDRPTKAHEYIFLLAKSERYYYDQDAIREPQSEESIARAQRGNWRGKPGLKRAYLGNPPRGLTRQSSRPVNRGRNKRTVWTVPTRPFKGAHFAVFPPDLIRPCILAGCPAGGIVLDPFFGAGTVGVVALQEGRHFIGIELNPEYCEMARERINKVMPKLVVA